MNTLKLIRRLLTDIQITSALIWAATILACSFVTDKSYISSILITAAGCHVVLLTHFVKSRNNEPPQSS